MPVVMQLRLGIVVLPGEAQVDGGLLPVAVRVLVREGLAEGIAVVAPDRGTGGVGGDSWGAELIGVEMDQGVGGALRDLGDRGLVVVHVGPDRGAGVAGLGNEPAVEVVVVDRGGGAGDLAGALEAVVGRSRLPASRDTCASLHIVGSGNGAMIGVATDEGQRRLPANGG